MTNEYTRTDGNRIVTRRRLLRATGVAAAGFALAGCAGPEEEGGGEETEGDVEAQNPFGPEQSN